MAGAWRGRASRLLLDRRARTTFGNARGVAAAARSLEIDEIVLVTSGWHRRRASALSRAALRGLAVSVRDSSTDENGTLRARARELACWTLVPFLAPFARGTR
jgi:threonine dehydratase